MNNWDNQQTEELLQAILSLKGIDEAKRFFRDLLTENELNEFANRWKAAQLLDAKVSYSQIEKETGLSSTTVARIAKWLNGELGGYKLVLDKLKHHHTDTFEKG